jgi:hypothetical protein
MRSMTAGCSAARLLTLASAWALCAGASAQPANDGCSDPLALTDGVMATFDTSLATATQPDIVNLCGFAESAPDIWFSYTPAQGGPVTISLCGSHYDTVLSVHAAGCVGGPTMAIACNDDAPGCTPGTTSRLTTSMPAGTTFLIRVAGYLGDAGPGRIIVTGGFGGVPPPTPDNDVCVAAASIVSGTTVFSTINAQTNGPAHPDPVPQGCAAFGSDQITGDVWFRYVAPVSGVLDVSTCGSSFDTRLAVYGNASCAELMTPNVLLACNDDAPCAPGSLGGGSPGVSSSVTVNIEPARTYLIRVGGYNGATGAGVLTLTARGVCDCDFDGSLRLTTQDLYEFLATWITGNVRADFNADQSVSVQDIFDFLQCFQIGCP